MAMIKGAILQELQKHLIEKRYLGWSVGIAWDEEFDQDIHNREDRDFDEHDGVQIVRECVRWLFRFVSISAPYHRRVC